MVIVVYAIIKHCTRDFCFDWYYQLFVCSLIVHPNGACPVRRRMSLAPLISPVHPSLFVRFACYILCFFCSLNRVHLCIV